MSGAVFPFCRLFGLRYPSTEACRLLDRANSQCQNGDLLESSHWIFTGSPATCPCPHCEPQPTSVSPGEPSRPPSRSGSGFYGVTALGPNTCKTLNVLSKSRVCFPQSCGAPALKPHWPQSQMLWELLLLMPDPQVEEPDLGLRTLTPVGELLRYYSPFCGFPACGYGIWSYRESAPPTHIAVNSSLWLYL